PLFVDDCDRPPAGASATAKADPKEVLGPDQNRFVAQPGQPCLPSLRVAIQLPISPGELLDKWTILEIKAARIEDPVKLANVCKELELVRDITGRTIPARDDIAALQAELAAVNERLWEIEDGIRELERACDFGPRFIELARSVYRTNDER